jgi:hypothetical protein
MWLASHFAQLAMLGIWNFDQHCGQLLSVETFEP